MECCESYFEKVGMIIEVIVKGGEIWSRRWQCPDKKVDTYSGVPILQD